MYVSFTGRGCPAAVVRIWTNPEKESPPIELCGEKGATDPWHYMSDGSMARISFTTTDKTVGAPVSFTSFFFCFALIPNIFDYVSLSSLLFTIFVFWSQFLMVLIECLNES